MLDVLVLVGTVMVVVEALDRDDPIEGEVEPGVEAGDALMIVQ